MGILLFVISAFMLLGVARAWATWLGQTPAERFWIAVVGAGVQLGTVAAGLSLFRAVTPATWLGVQAALLGATVLLTRRATPAPLGRTGILGEMLATRAATLASLAVLGLVGLAMAEQYALPVREFDDRMYHGSRAAYWLQHRSVFGYETHNDRQVSFPFGGELWFFWPLLFTRSEPAAQLAFGIGLPLCAAGLYWTLREAGASRNGAALGAATFCFAPMVLYHTRGIRPELWAATYATGCAFWGVRALRDQAPRIVPFALAGARFALAVNVKATALPMGLGLAVLPWLAPSRKARAAAAVVAGAALGLIFSGFVATAAYNWKEHRHPLGSREFRDVHRADLSRTQVRTHAVRSLLALLDAPAVPNPFTRQRLEDAGGRLAHALGARDPLPREELPWPGAYAYRVHPFAGDYSLAGLVWVPLLLAAVVGIAWDVAHTWPRFWLSTTSLLALFAAPTLLGAVFVIRWAEGVPRFWLPAYALGVLVFVPMLDRLAARRRWLGAACVVALVAMAAPAAWAHVRQSRALIASEFSPVGLDEPFFEPLAHVDDGSTILLLATQGSRDYPLFAPRRSFANRVVPWGKTPFDEGRMRRLIGEKRVTHVLVETEGHTDLFGQPATAPAQVPSMVNWLTQQSDFREISLPYTPGMRLFARIDANGPATTSPIR